MADLIKALAEVQNELKAPKNLFNKFGNYNYRSAESILEAVKPLLFAKGLLLTIEDDIVLIGERFYIKATATIKDGTGSEMHTTAFAREEDSKKGMDGSQITGTASSYARKYALNGLFLIDDTKDADTDEYKRQIESSKAEAIARISKANVDALKMMITEAGSKEEDVLKAYKVDKFENMNFNAWQDAMNKLQRKIECRQQAE